MKILTCFLGLVLFSLTAQETPNFGLEEKSMKHALGLHTGSSTGQGFSYRYFPNKWGVQVTGIPIFNGNNGFYTSSAVSVLYKIKEHKKLDLFTYLGNHLILERYQTYYGIWPGPGPTYVTDRTYTIGLGVGVNIHLWEVLDLSMQAGYGLNRRNNAPSNTIFSNEIGVYYKF